MRDTINFFIELALVFAGILAVYLVMCEMNQTYISKQQSVMEQNVTK